MLRSVTLALCGALLAAAMAANELTTKPAADTANGTALAGSQPASGPTTRRLPRTRPMDPERAALLAKAREARRQWELRRYDTNKDGKIDEEERKRMIGDRRRRYTVTAEDQKRFDANGDGELSPVERRAMDTFLRAQRGKMFVEMWDVDGNGKVDEEERKLAETYYRSRLTQRQQVSELRTWDRNRDGVLDARERARMEADQREARRTRRRWRQEPGGRPRR